MGVGRFEINVRPSGLLGSLLGMIDDPGSFCFEKLTCVFEQYATLGQVAPKGTLGEQCGQVPFEDLAIKALDDTVNEIVKLFEENVHVASVAAGWSASSLRLRLLSSQTQSIGNSGDSLWLRPTAALS